MYFYVISHGNPRQVYGHTYAPEHNAVTGGGGFARYHGDITIVRASKWYTIEH